MKFSLSGNMVELIGFIDEDIRGRVETGERYDKIVKAVTFDVMQATGGSLNPNFVRQLIVSHTVAFENVKGGVPC